MSTLIETVDAAVKLFASLEKRVEMIERIVGRVASPPPARTKVKPVTKPGRYSRKRTRVTNAQAEDIRRGIVAFIAAGGGSASTEQIRKAARLTGAQMWGYLDTLRTAGKVRRAAKGLWSLPPANTPVQIDRP